MRMLIAAALLALGLNFGAIADEPVCRASWAQGAAFFEARGAKVVELTKEQREAVQADYNSVEPKTDYVFGHIYTVLVPSETEDETEASLIVVLVSGEDCVVEVGRMSRERLLSIISRHST